jgi:hypothetical protein
MSWNQTNEQTNKQKNDNTMYANCVFVDQANEKKNQKAKKKEKKGFCLKVVRLLQFVMTVRLSRQS